MNFLKLNKIVYTYLALPILIFMLTWIKPLIGIPAAALIGYALYLSMKGSKAISIAKKNLLIALGIAFVWCFLAGQGGFYYQSDDHWARNAIFRDLINNSWPVVFEKHDVLLNYYIGYWLVPALLGKAAFLISKSTEFAWLIGRIFLLLWSTFSTTLCFLILSDIVACKSRRHFIVAVLFFVLFSGLDIVGMYLTNGLCGLHLEWWCYKYQYSSFTTCLFWVFNQAVPAWVATLLLLNDRRVENFAFCGLCIFISAPIPLIGLFPIYVAIGLQEVLKTPFGERYKVFAKMISLQNIIACVVIFPICLIYYADNAAIKRAPVVSTPASVSVEQAPAVAMTSAPIIKDEEEDNTIVENALTLLRFGTFYVLEAGVFFAILFRRYKKSILFWCIAIELAIIPFIHVGHASDFAMRASIPPLVVLMVMVLKDFWDCLEKRNLIFTLYCVVLAFAIMTPGKEFYRGVFEIVQKHRVMLVCDSVKTIENTIKVDKEWNNFISYDYSKSKFKKYLAR